MCQVLDETKKLRILVGVIMIPWLFKKMSANIEMHTELRRNEMTLNSL